MKLSISMVDAAGPRTPFVLRGDYRESILLAKSLGYDAVELHIKDPGSIDPVEMSGFCSRNGMAVSSLGTGLSYALDGLCLTGKDAHLRESAVGRVKEYISAAETLNAVVIIGLMKGNIPPEGDHAEYEARVMDSLAKCLFEAERRGVTLVLEAINRYESNFLVNIGETLDFIKKMNSRFLKIHIDTFHMNIEEADMLGGIEKCRGLLGHVHFADNDRMYPGHGQIQFKGIIEKLKGIGYDGYGAIECLPLPEPIEVARRSLDYLRAVS